MAKRRGRGDKKPPLPTRDRILEFIRDNPEKAGKREIARAFGIAGAARIELKALLREIAMNGGIAGKRGRKPAGGGGAASALASPALVDITARDSDGGLTGRPAAWNDADGAPPAISIRTPRGKKAIVAGIGDRVLAHIEAGEGGALLARVIKAIDKRKEGIFGILRADGAAFRLESVVKRQDDVTIDAAAAGGAKVGDLVEAQVARAGRYGPKQGRVIRVYGSGADSAPASLIAIHTLEIPHVFADEALREAAALEEVSLKNAPSPREDWRHLDLVTIDPEDARDHDDAVHAKADPAEAGGHVVTVAIADVAHHVRPAGAMDREALRRGNSVYFPDRVVPMLPERVSNDLCSLREGETRPALAVRMWFNADGRKSRHEFHRVLMKSRAKLAYAQAQAAIDGRPDAKTGLLLETALRPVWAAYDCLKRGRDAREPLNLDLPERKLLLRADGAVDRVVIPVRLDAHRLVEEFMIQANVAAAETLERKRQSLVYRVHAPPSLAKLEALREFLKGMGIAFSRGGVLSASRFNRVLAQAGADNRDLVNQIVLRAQSQAEYAPANIGHFGLNLGRYAHFTSPIRRYADLVVHRALIAALDLGEDGMPEGFEDRLAAIAADISMTERRAMVAERDTVDRLIARHLGERIGETFAGRINGVTRAGLFVTLDENGADGYVPISSISHEYLNHDEASHSLIGTETGTTWRIGQKVEVKLAEARPAAGALRFELLSEGAPSGRLGRAKSGASRPGASRSRRGGWRRR
jgi:ribonuclease R